MGKRIGTEREAYKRALRGVQEFLFAGGFLDMVESFHFFTWFSDSFCHLPRHYLDNQFMLHS